MRELTTQEIEEELAEQLPARELMGSTGAMSSDHMPMMVYHEGNHYYWLDVGPQYAYRK